MLVLWQAPLLSLWPRLDCARCATPAATFMAGWILPTLFQPTTHGGIMQFVTLLQPIFVRRILDNYCICLPDKKFIESICV